MRRMPDGAMEQTCVDTVLSPIEIGNFLKEMWFVAHPQNLEKKYDIKR